MTRYKLNIAFKMESYMQFLTEGKYEQFKYNDLEFELKKLSDIDNSYSLIIEPIESMEHAKKILDNMKLSSILLTLKYKWVSIEIDEDIKEVNVLDEPINITDTWKCSGDYDINQTTLIPIIPNLSEFQANPIKAISIIKIDNIIEIIKETESLDYEKIICNEKLSLALEIYLKHAQFSRKRQYLELITILEILKPEYSVSTESKEIIKDFKKQLKKSRNVFEKYSEEYMEFDRYFSDIKRWESKSINKSLQKFVKEHQNEFKEYQNIDEKIKDAYNIRSIMVHEGRIDEEEFEEYFSFLKGFVGKLLKVMLYVD